MTTTARLVPVVAVAVLVLLGTACSSQPSNNGTPPAAAPAENSTDNVLLASMKVEYRKDFTKFIKLDAAEAAFLVMKNEIDEAKASTTESGHFYINAAIQNMKNELVSTKLFAGVTAESLQETEDVFREMGIDPVLVFSREDQDAIHMEEREKVQSEIRQKLTELVAKYRR